MHDVNENSSWQLHFDSRLLYVVIGNVSKLTGQLIPVNVKNCTKIKTLIFFNHSKKSNRAY